MSPALQVDFFLLLSHWGIPSLLILDIIYLLCTVKDKDLANITLYFPLSNYLFNIFRNGMEDFFSEETMYTYLLFSK